MVELTVGGGVTQIVPLKKALDDWKDRTTDYRALPAITKESGQPRDAMGLRLTCIETEAASTIEAINQAFAYLRKGCPGLADGPCRFHIAVHPRSFYAGGDPTSIVNHIHWKRWGTTFAIGTARAFYVPPRGPVAAGYKQPARIVASRLGTCRGRYAYRRVQWYFPTRRPHYKKLGNYGFNAAECAAERSPFAQCPGRSRVGIRPTPTAAGTAPGTPSAHRVDGVGSGGTGGGAPYVGERRAGLEHERHVGPP